MDEELRRLERAAATGDAEAREALAQVRARLEGVCPPRELPYIGAAFRMGLDLPGPPDRPGSDERVDAVDRRSLPAHRRWWIGLWQEYAHTLAAFAGAGVQGIRLTFTTDASLAEVRRLAEAGEAVTHLHLRNNAALTDAGLAELAHVRSLRGLTIEEPAPNLTPAALDGLAQCPGLTDLDLGSLGVLRGGATSWLEPLQQLASVRLSGTFDVRYDLDPLQRLPALRALDLHIVDDERAPGLAALAALEALSISYMITGEAFRSLAHLQRLKRLDISGVGVTRDDLALLGTLLLEHLGLYAVDLWEDELVELPRSLRSLDLTELLNPDALAPLAELPELASLTIHPGGPSAFDGLPERLADCAALRRLRVTRLDDDAPDGFLAELAAALPRLEALILERPQASGTFAALGDLCDLTHLRLSQPQGLQDLAFLRRLPALTHLHLASCEELDASALETLQDLRSLQWLSLSDCLNLPHDAHDQLARALPNCVVCY